MGLSISRSSFTALSKEPLSPSDRGCFLLVSLNRRTSTGSEASKNRIL